MAVFSSVRTTFETWVAQFVVVVGLQVPACLAPRMLCGNVLYRLHTSTVNGVTMESYTPVSCVITIHDVRSGEL